MASKRRPAKKAEGKIASAIKKPAPKKSIGVAKKPLAKKPVGKTPAAIKKETKKSSTIATSKTDNLIKEEHEKNFDKPPAGNTRAAKKRFEEAQLINIGKSVTATSKKPIGRPAKPPGETPVATKAPTPEHVDVPIEDAPKASPKRKRETQDKWTETTDLPVSKSPKSENRSTTRRYKTLKDCDSEGWDANEFSVEESESICCIDEVDSCRIPSPFAFVDSGDQSAPFAHFVWEHTTDNLRNLYHPLNLNAVDYKASMVESLPSDGAGGRFYLLKKRTHQTKAGGKLVDEGEGTEKDEIEYHDYPRNVRKYCFKVNDSESEDMQLDVRCLKNQRTGEIGYFIINNVIRKISINDGVLGYKLAAGPLPNFAIIEMNDCAIFWFRNRAALDYVPKAASTVAEDKEDATNGISLQMTSKEGKDTNKDPTPPPADGKEKSTAEEPNTHTTDVKQKYNDTTESQTSPLTWEDIMNDGLGRHRDSRAKNGNTPSQIKYYQGMIFDQALLAVATIWEALRNQGMTYAFAGEEILNPEFANAIMPGSCVIGGKENTFIMPLFFPPDTHTYYKKHQEKKAKQREAKTETEKQKANKIRVPQPLGHILLAVARKGSPKAESIQIEIRDSWPGIKDLGDIHKRAREVAAKWSGMNADPVFETVKVVQQPYDSNACGLLTILNAWAVMLGIPLLADRRRRTKASQDVEFLELGLEIVNLALDGFMDSRTIQAFLNVYGYSEDQDVNTQPSHTVDAVEMDAARLKRLLLLQKPKDAVGDLSSHSPSQASALNPGSTDSEKAKQESKVQFFTERAPEATPEQVTKFIAADPDIHMALVLYKSSLSKPDEPIESDAD